MSAKGQFNENPPDISFIDLIKEDLKTNDNDIFSQGFIALFINRFGNWRMSFKNKIVRAPMTILYKILRRLCQWTCGIKLDYTVKVGRRLKIEHFGGIIIGAESIGNDVTIRQNTTIGLKDMKNLESRPTIGNNVNIGAGAVIVGKITIGDNCNIGANTVISFDIPDNSNVKPAQSTVYQRKINNA